VNGEQVHLSKTKSSKIFHAMSWNICGIFIFHGKFSSDVAKYLMTCHGIFCRATKVFFGINNGFIDSKHGLGKQSF
jgi:hypothetical protein